VAAFEAWLVSLILVVNVVGEVQRKRTLAASRGFLAAARLSCIKFDSNCDHRSDDRETDGIAYDLRHKRNPGTGTKKSCFTCLNVLPIFLGRSSHSDRQGRGKPPTF